MALFFDQAWFDARLKELGATRDDVARLLKLSHEQVAELWKDQRELRGAEVQVLATYLKTAAAEVASRAGVSTPIPAEPAPINQRLDEMNERLTRIERMLVELKNRTTRRSRLLYRKAALPKPEREVVATGAFRRGRNTPYAPN